MFTGIVEDLGTVKEMKQVSRQAVELTIESAKITEDVQLGDSISVNGICLTVTAFDQNQFKVDAMPETIQSTSLNLLDKGSKVNLERAMAAGGRFGGHFVSGHVDGVGTIIRKQRVENAIYYDIEIPESFMELILHKGSITVDGISLTVFAVKENSFTISLIPHTAKETVLGEKDVGAIVNIECDMLAKYVKQLLGSSNEKNTGITKEVLQANGFI
jgi:riboflavin synthase